MYHGTWWDQWDPNRGDSLDELQAGRFTTLLPELPAAQFEDDDLKLLAEEMTAKPERRRASRAGLGPEEDRDITAAYTYLGQFVDHDLTFDPTSRLREFLDRDQIGKLADFRTPRFDLDNLYGRGPDDQPYLYQPDGIRMQLGESLTGNDDDPYAAQVPRGPNGRALIGDPRNDENRIVSQLHAIFLRFHNQVAEHFGKDACFQNVRDQVRWHYQWMLVKDFLPTILDDETYGRVFADPYNPVPGLRELRTGLKLMPVEFSVAAYRFGHSMIRREYRLNDAVERPIFSSRNSGGTADLAGFSPIPSDWAIDWNLFINLEPSAIAAAAAPPGDPAVRRPQHAYKIDTSLASPLRSLPHGIASNPPPMLALRNLQRGNIFRLPSGQHMARALGVEPVPDESLKIGKATTDADQKPLAEISTAFEDRAPLWTYILAEAQAVSWAKADASIPKVNVPIKLGPVGSRLIADVFAALLIGDGTSYLYHDGPSKYQDGPFKPIPKFARGEEFGLAQLINAALEHTP
jgi:hypothetical protein